MTETKKCSCCGQEKDRSEFGKNRAAKDGLHYYCKECHKAKQSKYRVENPDKEREYQAKWRAENREKERERRAKYYAENPEKVRKCVAKWQKENPEKCWVSANKRRALKQDRLHPDHNTDQEEAFYTYAKVLEEIHGEPYEVDHILPLNKGGWHHHLNLQVIPRRINRQKGDSLEWSHPDYLSWRDLPFFLQENVEKPHQSTK